MRVVQVAFHLIAVLGLTFNPHSGVCAETHHEEDQQKLFNRAVSVEGPEYLQVRDAIVARGAEAVPFLKQATSDKDRTRRILAAAMLDRISQPQRNTRREELVHSAVLNAIGHITGVLSSVRAAAVAPFVSSGWLMPGMEESGPRLRDEWSEASAVPFLLEIALKGAIHRPQPQHAGRYGLMPREAGRNEAKIRYFAKHAQYCLWARCYAIALVGGLEGPDVIPVLTELLRSGKDAGVRSSAATGLANTESAHAVEPLLIALRDKDRQVREEAEHALRRITGQDFGADQSKWKAWWRQNKERLLEEKK